LRPCRRPGAVDILTIVSIHLASIAAFAAAIERADE
jgi:hypothetical protein